MWPYHITTTWHQIVFLQITEVAILNSRSSKLMILINKIMVIFQINEMDIQILVLFISMFDRIFFPLFIQRPLWYLKFVIQAIPKLFAACFLHNYWMVKQWMFEGNTCLNEHIRIGRDVSSEQSTRKCMLTTNLKHFMIL